MIGVPLKAKKHKNLCFRKIDKGFIPQILRGYRTKSMDDVSYFLMVFISVGMLLWVVYGLLRDDVIIMWCNATGAMLNLP